MLFQIEDQQVQRDRPGRRTGGYHFDPGRVGFKLTGEDRGDGRLTVGPLAVAHSAARAFFDVVKIHRSFTNGLTNLTGGYRFAAAYDGIVG